VNPYGTEPGPAVAYLDGYPQEKEDTLVLIAREDPSPERREAAVQELSRVLFTTTLGVVGRRIRDARIAEEVVLRALRAAMARLPKVEGPYDALERLVIDEAKAETLRTVRRLKLPPLLLRRRREKWENPLLKLKPPAPSPLLGMADNDLFLRFQQQEDKAAFAELENRHRGKLLKRAAGQLWSVARTPRRARASAVAEEVVQETWARLAAWARRTKQDPFRGLHTNSFLGLMWRVFRAVLVDARKEEQRQRHAGLADERKTFDLGDNLADPDSGRRSSHEAQAALGQWESGGRLMEHEAEEDRSEQQRENRLELARAHESLRGRQRLDGQTEP
jgi:hypothetical protein